MANIITPKQAYEGLIKIEPRYAGRLVTLAECVVLRGVSKDELMSVFYSTDAGKELLESLRSYDAEAEFRMVIDAALDYVIADMRAKQAKAGLN